MPQVKTTPYASNHCHVEYFNLTLSLLLNSWLTRSRVLFVVSEGNLSSGLNSIGRAHTVSGVFQEPWTGFGYDHEIQYKHHWHCQGAFLELHSWWSGSTRPGAQVSLTHSCYLWSRVSLCLSRKAVKHERSAIYFLGRRYLSCQHIASCQRLCIRPHPSDSVAMPLKNEYKQV